jgi:biotin transporter BioY
MKVNVVNEGIKWGCINGLIAVLIMYGTWAAGLQTFVSVSFWANFCPYMIVILIIAGLQLKKQNDGILPYSQALKFTFLSYVVVAVIGAIGTYILYNLIDPDLTAKSIEVGIEKTRSMMEKFGAKEEDIDKAIKGMREDGAKGTGIGKILLGTGLFLIWDFVKSLLISLVIRKEEKFAD